MTRARKTVVSLHAMLACGAIAAVAPLAAQTTPAPQAGYEPKFVEIPCSTPFGSAATVRKEEVRCGTVTVPQNRRTPNDARLLSVVLPVVIYSLPGVKGTPMFFAGGPGESAIEGVQQLFLKTTTGQLAVRERPIIAFDRRGHSPVLERGNPELGTVTFQASGRRENTIGPIRDSLARRMKDLRAQGVDPANFTTAESVEDIADVAKALHLEKVVLFGVSYGTHDALRFMHTHPRMVEAVVLDGVAPPSATQLLDSTYLTSKGRAIIGNIVAECKADPACASEYDDLPAAVATLAGMVGPMRRTAELGPSGDWRTLEVSGSAVLSVLGVASTSEEVLTNVPRIIVDFVGRDTLKGDLSPRVLFAAAMDPSLLAGNRQSMTLAYLVALCGDRPQGEPRAGDRRLCDVLGVPFGGSDVIAPVQSDIPTLLISSGYDAQTPADLADSAAKTLTHFQRVHFPRTGHVAFARPMVMACVAVIVESFLLRPEQVPPTGCISGVAPAFAPRGGK